jgi:hypothetical protein
MRALVAARVGARVSSSDIPRPWGLVSDGDIVLAGVVASRSGRSTSRVVLSALQRAVGELELAERELRKLDGHGVRRS